MEKIIFNFNIFDGVKTAMLCESEFSKEIRITMAKDAVMKEHMAPNAIIVQVLRGGIEFEMSGKILVMNEFDMITLPAFIPHSLKALENSIIRLRITTVSVQANSSSVSRYGFDSNSCFPIDIEGSASTSAAIPAFHASPRDERHAEMKYGKIDGI